VKPDPLADAKAEGISTGLHCAYQPIVDLRSRQVVGYEALARGSAGGPLEAPEHLFAHARRRLSGGAAELAHELVELGRVDRQ
jgi:EAL domain-containing protein (putative c-di-GMP-specific phosphodiesterase class I)